jgi:DNA-binding response OmpR family regulator
MDTVEIEEKSRILVVEDEADIQLVICLYLRYAGFEVCGVSNGQEAIRRISEFEPDLIVLDVLMHPMSGWDVLDWLRAHRITPPLPVIVLTALTQSIEQIHGFEEGAIEYMTKPTQPSLLLQRIRAVLALNAEQRLLLRGKRMEERRKLLERLNAAQQDEFSY